MGWWGRICEGVGEGHKLLVIIDWGPLLLLWLDWSILLLGEGHMLLFIKDWLDDIDWLCNIKLFGDEQLLLLPFIIDWVGVVWWWGRMWLGEEVRLPPIGALWGGDHIFFS